MEFNTEILIDLIENGIHIHKFISLSKKLNELTRETTTVTVVVVFRGSFTSLTLDLLCMYVYMLFTGF